MRKILLVAALVVSMSGCDNGGYVTRQEAAQAFQQRDRAIEILAHEISVLQEKVRIDPKKEREKKGEK